MTVRRALDVRGELRLEAPRSAMELRADGSELRLVLARARGLFDLWTLSRALPLPGTSQLLAESGLGVAVVVDDRAVARVGRGARPARLLPRLLGLGPRVDIRLSSLLGLAVRRLASRLSARRPRG